MTDTVEWPKPHNIKAIRASVSAMMEYMPGISYTEAVLRNVLDDFTTDLGEMFDGVPVAELKMIVESNIAALDTQSPVGVKPLVWEDDEGAFAAKDFRIYNLEHHNRDVWRLIQADFGTQYRGDFGGKDGYKKAMKIAETIHQRRIRSALTDDPTAQTDSRIEELEDELEDLQAEFNTHQEKLSVDFEKDCWQALRSIIDILGFDWANDDGGGVTANHALEFAQEAISDLKRPTARDAGQAEPTDAETELGRLIAEIVQIEWRLSWECDLAYAGKIQDGAREWSRRIWAGFKGAYAGHNLSAETKAKWVAEIATNKQRRTAAGQDITNDCLDDVKSAITQAKKQGWDEAFAAGERAGIERAAKWHDDQFEAIANETGSYDSATNETERSDWENSQLEWHEEASIEVRKLVTEPATPPPEPRCQGCEYPDCIDAGCQSRRGQSEPATPPTAPEPVGDGGWIVGNGSNSDWRLWKDGLPGWTPIRDKATRFARRADAEAVHQEDDDAWTIQPYKSVALMPTPFPDRRVSVAEAAKVLFQDVIPDKIEIYRLIKSSGARKHGEIAKVVSEYLRNIAGGANQ